MRNINNVDYDRRMYNLWPAQYCSAPTVALRNTLLRRLNGNCTWCYRAYNTGARRLEQETGAEVQS